MDAASLRRLALLALVVGPLGACGDSSSSPADAGGHTDTSDAADASDGSSADVGDDTDDAGADGSGPDTVDDAGPDAEQDTAEDTAPLECDPPRRPVGTRCRSENDRICLVDTDCRSTERCEFEGDEEFGTCIYQLPDPFVCPGSEGCAPVAGAPLRAGFGARVVTPEGWEFGRPGHVEDPDQWGNPKTYSGDITDADTFCDCGTDMICPPTPEFADCYSAGEWTAPDANGTEGDGYMQGAWIAGFSTDRNAQLCGPDRVGDDCAFGDDCCVDPRAHDHQWARTVVIDQGDSRVAFVSVDAVGFFYSDLQRVFAELPPELGIDRIMTSATHTHEAPDTMGRWGASVYNNGVPTESGVIPEHMRVIYDGIIGSIEDAVAELTPADVYVGKANTGAEGFAVDDSRHPFVFNDLVVVMQFVRDGQDRSDPANNLGVLFNWHSHPEALGGDNMYISSDFSHYTREYLEQGLPEVTDLEGVVHPAWPGLGGVAVYASGSVGGLMTPLHTPSIARDGSVYDEESFGKARALGERLAELGLRTLATPCTDPSDLFECSVKIEDESLSFAFTEYMLDLQNAQFQAAGLTLGLFYREIYNYRFSDQSSGGLPQVLTSTGQIRIGNAAIQAFPGEMFPELILGGYTPENVRENVIVGNPRDVNCDATLRVRLADGVEPRFPCTTFAGIEAECAEIRNEEDRARCNVNLDAAPTDGFVRDLIETDYLFVAGLGNDSLGYIVPSYDFRNEPLYLTEAPGDHYEETVSVGDLWHVMYENIETVNALVEATRD